MCDMKNEIRIGIHMLNDCSWEARHYYFPVILANNIH